MLLVRDWRKLQPAIAYASRNVRRNVTLKELTREAGGSASRAHRALRAALGETPKQFILRLRVDRAAAALVHTHATVLEIGLAFGFESHETFCRAFQRRYGMSPSGYRRQGLGGTARQHAEFVAAIGPCVGLYQIDRRASTGMEYKITTEERAEQPVLVIRKRVRRADIAATIGAELPKVFLHAQKQGIAISGFPVTRYVETSWGLVTLETGMRVASAARDAGETGEGDVIALQFPGGLTAVTVHAGPYDQLQNAYAALEEWMAAKGFKSRGAPWEAYLNDPGEHPDPAEWKTEVCWPVAAA